MAGVETIGDIRRRRAAEGKVYPQTGPFALHHRPESPRNTELATHLYSHPTIPDRLSSRPVGRHRPEHISSQGEKPREMLAERTKNYTGRHHLPSEPEAKILARLQAQAPSPVEAEAVISTDPAPREAKHRAVESLPQQRRHPVRAVAPVHEQPSTRNMTTESKFTTPRHAATELKTSPNLRRGTQRRLVAAATAVVLAGIAISGGLAFLRKNHAPIDQQANNTAHVLTIPEVPKPLEIPIISLTEQRIISEQDGNQWQTAAKQAEQALDEQPSNGVTNIVAKVGAYDSRGTSPDPDAAGPGDIFVSLNDRAIKEVASLHEPLGPNASQAEIAAAQIIDQLNNLGPMETKVFIEHYGSKIEELKQHLTQILNPQETNVHASFAPAYQAYELTAASEKDTSVTKPKETTIFSRIFNNVTSIFKPDIQTKGRKALAALAAERDRRQTQRSTI